MKLTTNANRSTHRNIGVRCLLSLVAVTVLSACPVNSTAISDSELIAKFLVQNDNGLTNAIVTFGSSDLAGFNDVDLVAGESISYLHHQQVNRQGDELRSIGDGRYEASLASDAAGWYSFTLLRLSEDREDNEREITKNYVYLPGSFQEMLAETVQSGPAINIYWSVEVSRQPSIDGFQTTGIEDSFNAIGTCQNEGETFEVAITEGQITQQNAMWLLEIAVSEHLQQVLGLPTEALAAVGCKFDVQLVRTVIGATDVALSNRSSASGQVLKNVQIQWTAQ